VVGRKEVDRHVRQWPPCVDHNQPPLNRLQRKYSGPVNLDAGK
jgi:hypothetical protein